MGKFEDEFRLVLIQAPELNFVENNARRVGIDMKAPRGFQCRCEVETFREQRSGAGCFPARTIVCQDQSVGRLLVATQSSIAGVYI